MLKKSTLLLVVFCACAALVHAQVTTDPVGFVSTNLKGTGGTASSALTFVGLSLTQPVEFQGTVATYDPNANSIAFNNVTFTSDQFDGSNGAYFLEIASGTNAGFLSDVTATGTSPASITAADNLAGKLSGGETIKIRKHWTLQSVFGPNTNTNNQVLLGAGPSSSSADEVLIYDRTSQQYVTFYYKQGGITGGNGWRSTSGNNALSTDVSAQIMRITDGAIVRRKQSADVALTLPGAVKLGQTQRAIVAGLNFTGTVYPSGATLANSGLYNPNDSTNSIQGGGSSTADQILVYDGANYTTYYYKIGGITGGNGWRSTSSQNPLSDDMSNTPLPVGQSVIVKRIASQSFTWTEPQPF